VCYTTGVDGSGGIGLVEEGKGPKKPTTELSGEMVISCVVMGGDEGLGHMEAEDEVPDSPHGAGVRGCRCRIDAVSDVWICRLILC
ncbi:hypothetical protein Tco_0714432, partial [Tanacetum coccineum]